MPSRRAWSRYNLTCKEGQPADFVPADSRQSLQPGANQNTAILTVESRGPLDGVAGPTDIDPQF